MKTITNVFCSAILMLLVPGCSSHKPVLQRGWVGGEFLIAESRAWKPWNDRIIHAFPAELESKQKAALFVSNVYSNTPLAMADIQPGDLILAVDQHRVENADCFYKTINHRQPGSTASLSVFRNGAIEDHKVTIGREAYKNSRLFSVGIVLFLKVDLIPNPDFSLIAFGYPRKPNHPELRSPRSEFIRRIEVEEKQKSETDVTIEGESSNFWVLVFGLDTQKAILSQEISSEQLMEKSK